MSRDFAQLEGRTAVVTGSSSGIGRAIACELAEAGANVLIHYCRAAEAAEETARLMKKTTGKTSPVVQADFANSAGLKSFVDSCLAELGEIDIWVNNAGVDLLTGEQKDLSPEEKLRKLLEVDVTATFLLARQIGEVMKQQKRGAILNIGWDQADRGMEGDSGELFATSKNAIMGFSRSLAMSLAPEVRVNCLSPGWIQTSWGESASAYWQERVMRETPLKRWGTPEDIARTARFLLSDEASFITGQVINVNGGVVR